MVFFVYKFLIKDDFFIFQVKQPPEHYLTCSLMNECNLLTWDVLKIDETSKDK